MKSNMPVLLVAYYYPPSDAAAAPRPFRFATHLPAHGFQPFVLTTGYSSSDPANVFRVGVRGTSRFRRCVGWLLDQWEVRIVKYRLQLPWAMQAIDFLRNYPQDHWEIVHSVGPPFGVHAIAAWVKRRYGALWIADLQDPIALPRSKTRSLREWTLTRLVTPLLDRHLIRHADILIANTLAVQQMLQIKYPKWKQKIYYLPNGLDAEMCARPVVIPERDVKVLTHCGDFYIIRHPAKLLESLLRLTDAGSVSAEHLRVRFIGELDLNPKKGPFSSWNGCSREKVNMLLAAPWLHIVRERVARAVAHKAIAESDYSLLIDIEGPLSKYFHPAKIFDYISIGHPILCFTEHGSPVDELLPITGIPYVTVYYTDDDKETDCKVAAFFNLPNTPIPFSAQFEAERGGAALTARLVSIYRNAQQTVGKGSAR